MGHRTKKVLKLRIFFYPKECFFIKYDKQGVPPNRVKEAHNFAGIVFRNSALYQVIDMSNVADNRDKRKVFGWKCGKTQNAIQFGYSIRKI